MNDTISISEPTQNRSEQVPIRQDPVARSIAREDAFMKPGSVGKTNGRGTNAVRVRMSNPNPKGKARKRKHDPRDVKFW